MHIPTFQDVLHAQRQIRRGSVAVRPIHAVAHGVIPPARRVGHRQPRVRGIRV